MSAAVTRYVAVDDTDAGIQYVGSSWRQDTGSYDTAGNFGPPYKRTLHGTDVDASFSYTFSGTGVNVTGFNNFRNDSGVLDPSWECLVDDISIQLGVKFQYPEHNWLFCSASQLPDGPHNLTVKAMVKREQTFWFDEIIYTPSPTDTLDEKDVIIDNVDLVFDFGTGWQSFSAISNMTQTPNSTITFNFMGSSLAWYGFIPGDYPTAATSGTYSIDDQTPVNFVLNGLPPGDITAAYNQKLFETIQYPIGNHKIVVTYLGGPKVTPLVLDYLIINNRTSTLPAAIPTTPLSPTSSPSTTVVADSISHPNRATNKIGPAVGGTLGGMVLILIAMLAAFYFRRWDRMHPNKMLPEDLPKEYIVSPFYYDREAATTIVQPRRPPPPPVETTRNKIRHLSGGADGDPFVQQQESGPSSANDPRHAMMDQATIDRKQRLAREAETREAALRLTSSSASASDPRQTMMAQATIDRKRRLAREAEARAAALRPLSSSATPSHNAGFNSVPLIRHEDSGIRLPPPADGGAVEIPPMYTIG